jgi:Aspartyl protease/Bacterial SH3 domain
MAVSRAFPPGKLTSPLVFMSLLIFWVAIHAAEVSTLVVNRNQAYLRAQQQPEAEVVAELRKGDKLTPLANALGNASWYLVQTQQGLTGWIPSSDVGGTESLERIFKEPDNVTSSVLAPNEGPSSTDGPVNRREARVPIEMNGSMIIVPVELNRSVKTYMMLDTGATLTTVSSALAKKLRLVSGQRISMTTPGGTTTANLSRLGSLKVGNAEAHSLIVAIHNFSPHPRTEGVLGLNFLSQFQTSIDSKNQRLILTPR